MVCGGGLPQFAASASVCCLDFSGGGYMIPSLDITTCFSCMDFVGELCRYNYYNNYIMHSLKYHARTHKAQLGEIKICSCTFGTRTFLCIKVIKHARIHISNITSWYCAVELVQELHGY